MELSAGKLWGLRRLADAGGHFTMLAVDQRPPIIDRVREVRGTDEAAYDDVCAVKRALIEALGPRASALLLDPLYAYPTAVDAVSPAQGLLVTLETHRFRETPEGRFASEIPDWGVAKIKRLGADAVKVLAHYRPDGPEESRRHQEAFVERIGRDCARYDIPYLLELLVYPLPGESADDPGYRRRRPERVLESVEVFADPRYAVDVFKLESPVTPDDLPETGDPDDPAFRAAQAHFDALGATCPRPWVMLSAGAGMGPFRRVLRHAYRAGASGYLCGRAIWWRAFRHFPDLAAMSAELGRDAVAYMDDINALTAAEALPWRRHRCFADGPRLAGAGEGFERRYPGFGEPAR